MRRRSILRAIVSLSGLVSLAGAVSAQTNLNKTPSRALGQPQLTLTTGSPNLVEGRELYGPQALAIDNTVNPPILYVSDALNNRVLGWKNASAFSNGAKADFVIGQKDLLSTPRLGPGTAFSTGLNYPTGLAVDKGGNLYVIDTGNNRILRFPQPYKQTDQFPNLVIGQTSFSCNTCNQPNSGGISAKTIAVFGNLPLTANIIFDTAGNLWFTDAGNNRVLRYPASALTANTPAADLVLGQLDFTTGTLPAQLTREALVVSKTALYQPNGLAFDPAGRLYVSDSAYRVLVFQPNLSPQTFDNGRAALRIMGLAQPLRPGVPIPQPNQYQFFNPSGIFMVGASPGIVDTGNHRLVLFDPFGDPSWPADVTASPPAKSSTGPVGQGAYTIAKPNRALPEPRNNTLLAPTFALATATELFVVDSGNNRVLVFPLNGLGQNSVATRVLGQDDFTFGAPNLLEGREMYFGPSSTGSYDGDLVIDTLSGAPHLYIADPYNNRVLGYRDARTVRPGDKADLVIGQPDFQRSVVNYPSGNPDTPTAQGLFGPVGLALDSNGNLFVSDTGNGRVLRFPKPFDQPQMNFPFADLVIGQSDFATKVTDPTQRTMHFPYGLAFTSDGGLLVSDAALNRVLFFAGQSAGFTNGMSASKVFGQSDFFSFQSGPDTNQMNAPKHIATDSDDRLYVADEANNRVLIFDNTGFVDTYNSRAVTVLGGPNPNNGFGAVRGLFVSKITGEIWVTEASNNRISRFPKFDDLQFQQNSSNFQIFNNPGVAGVAIAQDSFGDVFVGESANRIAIYYPGLSALNAANNIQGRALAPGAIVTGFRQGNHFTEDSATADPANWPTDLSDVQVLVNNSPAPIRDVSADQVNFLMPMSAPNGGTVEVQVIKKSTGQILGAGQVSMAPASPALFTRNGFGTGQLVATNDDGTANEPSNPVGRGKVISLFGTGQGYVDGAPPDGQAPSGPIPTASLPRVFIGTQFVPDENVMYSGLAPGQVGVWQVDVKIPDLVAPSPLVQVFVQLRSISSSQPPQVQTIAVKQQ